MCWGMIGWGWKGPFHVWDPETKSEKEEAAKFILEHNTQAKADELKLNSEWQASEEYRILKEKELLAARKQLVLEKAGAVKVRIPQTHRGKKFKIDKLKRREGCGVDSWRYIKHVAKHLLWPECK